MINDKGHITVKFSKAKLGKRNKGLAIIHDVGSDLTSSLGLKEILDRAVGKVGAHYKVDVVRIYLTDLLGKELELVSCAGFLNGEAEDLRKIPVREGFSGKAVRTKSFIAQRVTDLGNSARRALLQAHGFKVVICVPLIVKEEVVGVMNLAAKRTISLTQNDVDLFMAVGNQIAIAVNVAKLHEEIKRKKEELEFFAYTISHDLKSPSVGIVGIMDTVLRRYGEALDVNVRRYCEVVKKAADQILTLVAGINEYISATGTPSKLEKVSIQQIFQQVQDELSQELEKRNIRLLVPEEDQEILADELGMTRVFRNLINNSLKHGGEGLTKITISYHSDEHLHIFAVNNDGRAICLKDCSHLFEMFRRLPSSRQTEGSGLGLAIVRDIVESHGGKAWVESDSVKGTTFYFSVAKDTPKFAAHLPR